jgi:Flp pilus assembly protein TadG
MIRNSVTPRHSAKRRLPRQGVAAVEFALIAPVFFMLALGIVEFGRMLMVQSIITNAARIGARQAILSSGTTSNVDTAVSNYLSAAKISGATTTISPSLSPTPSAGTAVTVTVSVPCSSVAWTGIFPINMSSTTLSASVVMIHE